jgi:antirestriction protein
MIKLYVANLGKYNEGLLAGEWFDLSEGITLEEIRVAIGVAHYDEEGNFIPYVEENDGKYTYMYEEWAIHDYEAPFSISEYANIEELIELAERLDSMEEHEANAVCAIVNNGSANTYDEACDMVENGDVHFYFECKDMEDVAYNIVEESGMLDNAPETLTRYFDYEAYGRDLDIEGTFLELEDEVMIQVLN